MRAARDVELPRTMLVVCARLHIAGTAFFQIRMLTRCVGQSVYHATLRHITSHLRPGTLNYLGLTAASLSRLELRLSDQAYLLQQARTITGINQRVQRRSSTGFRLSMGKS